MSKLKLCAGIFSGVALATLAGCGEARDSQAKLHGHFENASESDLPPFQGNQSVVAEYEPTQAVLVSRRLFRYGRADFARAITEAGADVWVMVPRGGGEPGEQRRILEDMGQAASRVRFFEHKSADSDDDTVWTRDWAPLTARITRGENKGSFRLLDFNYYRKRDLDDATPASLAAHLGWDRVSLPVYNEGGNFMNNRKGDCFMTDRVVGANQTLASDGDRKLDARDIEGYYKDYAGCRKVYLFPVLPDEQTAHIDIWAKVLDDETVLVGQISDAQFKAFRRGDSLDDQEAARVTQDYLDDRARDLQRAGFQVKRVPMPLPYHGVYRSYTNSLFVNGTAFIPRYKAPDFKPQGVPNPEYYDVRLLADYEKEVARVYREAGFKPVFFDADSLVEEGGTLHCVTMQVPAP